MGDKTRSNYQSTVTKVGQEADFDAVIVGAGFAGMYQLHRLRDDFGLSVKVIERADDVGGTWYWNRYPGARCDTESHLYCYSFNDEIIEEWEWSERYPQQPEVLEYLRFVADFLDLRRDIEFETEVISAVFDEESGTWKIHMDDGSEVTADYFINAVGCLSEPYVPDFDEIDSYEGELIHTGEWVKHEPVDFEDKRVAVIGTGATGIQVIPEVAKEDIENVTVFQRTANYAAPAGNRPIDSDEWRGIKENYDDIWEASWNSGGGSPSRITHETAEDLSMEEVEEILEPRWQEGGHLTVFEDLRTNKKTNEKVSEFIRNKIREIVDDPELTEKLVPTDHGYATKRPPLHTDYFKTFNEDHVSLVDVLETPIDRFTPAGIRTSDDQYEFDIIILATGFDAVTGTILNIDIEGRDGYSIQEKWNDGPETYLGLMVHGFPNMFTITGPQSPSVLSTMPRSIEGHVDWITDTIEYMMNEGFQFIEPTEAAEDYWRSHTNEVADATLYTEADSWYLGENIPGKSRVFLPYVGGFATYYDSIEEVKENDFEGFQLTKSLDELGREGSTPMISVLTREEPPVRK